eukprot:scaffold22328_cov18-Phaeocystis_antarctica.AAC.1
MEGQPPAGVSGRKLAGGTSSPTRFFRSGQLPVQASKAGVRKRPLPLQLSYYFSPNREAGSNRLV